MTTLRYDEPRLIGELDRLPKRFRIAFAAACAQRLLPAYARYSERSGRGDATTLTSILERLWRDIESEPMPSTEVEAKIEACMTLIPREDDGPWIDEQAAAEDAGAALAYALRCRKNGDGQESAWAARRAYEACDHFIINREKVDTNDPGAEEQVLAHPVVQAELLRQQRDLQELLGAVGESDPRAVLARLRSRSKAEAGTFFHRQMQ